MSYLSPSRSTVRRPARGQNIPWFEACRLNAPPPRSAEQLNIMRHLFELGWTLRAIGEALYAPQSRYTIRNWLAYQDYPQAPNRSWSYDAPKYKTVPRDSTPKVKIPREIPPHVVEELCRLTPIAQQYRSQYSDTHPAATAKARLNGLCRTLHFMQGYSIQELADAAGMSYRAMRQRVKK